MYHSSTCYRIVFNMNNEKGYFAFSYFIEYYFTTMYHSSTWNTTIQTK